MPGSERQAGHIPGPRQPPDDGPVLAVRELRTEFRLQRRPVTAVDGVSLTVRRGECVGLVGESGCGKSTTGLSVMRLLPATGHITSGSIRLNGRDLVPLPEREMQSVRGREVAMIYQDPMTALNPTMPVGKQISEAVRLHSDASSAQARARALEVLGLVGMPKPAERIDDYPHQLSGGLRQRVMIAMALASEPQLLIADEPTTALDVTIQAQILDLLDDLRQRLRMSVILITHDMGVIAGRADRVLVMYAGKVAESAGTGALFASTEHPYTEALLQSIPRLDHDPARRLPSVSGMPPDLARLPPGCRFAPRCRYAEADCTASEPVLDGPDEHEVACFHPVGSAPGSRPDATGEQDDAAAGQGAGISVRQRAEAQGGNGADPAAAVTLLEASSLVKEFALHGARGRTVKAVSGVSLALERGRTLGLVGESGCGKTTLGRVIVGLQRPTGGTVIFDGQDVTTLGGSKLRLLRRDRQLMFQDPYSSLDPRMRIAAMLTEPMVIQGIGTKAERSARAREMLTEVGLSDRVADLYPHELSGGQRQRVGLARALILNPRLIVADEPVSALDVSVQAQVLNLMRTLQQRHDLSYVVISHDLSVIRYLANEIAVMYLGKVVEIASAPDLFEHTVHPYTRGLIDAIPVPDPEQARSRARIVVHGELPSAIDPPSGCRFRTRCPLAQQMCAEQEPPLRAFGPGHRAACHFPLREPAVIATGGAEPAGAAG
jgi:peptide/nickel transport system ATP-binding protein